MASDETLASLIAQCKSGDVDAKVDALAKLQVLFEDDPEVADTDSVVAVLKSCLRSANHHLTAATLSALVPFVRLLSSSIATTGPVGLSSPSSGQSKQVQQIRQVLLAFLPTGGLLDRLGEQREKSRELARSALVALASVAFLSSPGGKPRDVPKGHESPLSILEKHVKELGLASKVFRVREQTILALVEIRQLHHTFPIRPYLPQLVERLEDTDGTVRDCARSSVVALFTGPQVSDAARADLKNEMAKKGVRKAIVEDVQSKLLSGFTSTPASEASDFFTGGADDNKPTTSKFAPQRPAPSRGLTASTNRSVSVSQASTSQTAAADEVAPSPATEVTTVYIASQRDLEQEFARMAPCFEGKETEHNWLDREKAVVRIRGMLMGEVYDRYPDTFFALLKGGMLEKTLKALQSLRTTVANHACFLYAELAAAMGHGFDPLAETVLSPLLKIAGFTKKILAAQSQVSVTDIITHTSPQPRLVLPLLWSYQQEKTVQARLYIIGHFKTYIEVHGSRPAGKASIEASNGLEYLDKAIRKTLADPNPGVREQARIAFWKFEEIWPLQAAPIMATLDTKARKELEKVNPRPGTTNASASTMNTPAAKKSSVAAAIAASRAKAKLIATAPPTLRHAATSGASAAAAGSKASPGAVRRPASPTVARRAASPIGGPRVGSPVSPARSAHGSRNGLASPPVSRSASPPVQRPVHVRSSTTSNAIAGRKPSNSLAMGIPSGRTREYSPSPPASPTPVGSAARRPLASSQTSPSSSIKVPRAALGASMNGHGHLDHKPRPSRLSFSSLSSTGSPADELISAVRIPLPPDSDDAADEFDQSTNLMSFSTAMETMDGSVPSIAKPGISESVLHEAYRAKAEQAESAAHQLTEVVHDDNASVPAAVKAILPTVNRSQPPVALALRPNKEPETPSTARLLAFENSPTTKASPTLSRVLYERNDRAGKWWKLRLQTLAEVQPPSSVEAGAPELLRLSISKLDDGSADVDTLRAIANLCEQNPTLSPPPSPTPATIRASANGMLTPTTPSPLGLSKRPTQDKSDVWDDGRLAVSLMRSLIKFLTPDKPLETLELGLVAFHEMILGQSNCLIGDEGVIFDFLLNVRYSDSTNVFEATNTIRNIMIDKFDPILGLSAIHKSLEAFLKSYQSETSNDSVRTSSYAFALIGLAKYILLLPAEVLEDELPRIRPSLLKALDEKVEGSVNIRKAAHAAIMAAQINLRDETQLFTLLSGLGGGQKSMLTYEFEKVGLRGGGYGIKETEQALRKVATDVRGLDGLQGHR